MEIFKLFGSIMVDNSKANDSISKTDGKAKGLMTSMGNGIKTVGKWGLAIGGAAAAGGAALFGMANNAAQATDRIDKMSQRLGMSREAFQQWDYVLSQNGVTIDSMQTGMKQLTKHMAGVTSGAESSISVYSRLDSSLIDVINSGASQEEVFKQTIISFQGMEDGVEKARLAQELFGKQGQEMLPMLNASSGSVEELMQKANDLGIVLSGDSIDAGVLFTDTMDSLKRGLGAVVTQVGVNVMPMIQTFADWIMSNMPTIQAVIGGFFDGVSWFVTTTVDICKALFGDFNLSWDGIMQSMLLLWQTYGVPLFEAIAPLIQAVYDNWVIIWDSVKLYFQTLWEIMMGAWTLLGKPIFDLIIGIVKLVADFFAERMPAISGFFKQMVSDISTFWENNLKPCFDAIGNFINKVLAPAFELVFNHIIAPAVDTAFKLISSLWSNFLKPVFTGITDFITGVFSGDFIGAFTGIVDAVGGIFGGIVSVIKAPLNLVIGIVNSFIDGLNTLQIPDWVPLIGGSGINLPKIPMLAKGTDYFAGGVALVGEEGPELVEMPRGARVNTATETKDRLASGMTVNIYSPDPLTPSEVARQIKNQQQKMALQFA